MNSIGVTWDEVPADQRNGDILNYTVSYYSDKSPQEGLKIYEKKTETRFAYLTHLTENTNYNITVLASNHEGDGPTSAPIVVTTSDGSKFFSFFNTVEALSSGHLLSGQPLLIDCRMLRVLLSKFVMIRKLDRD